MSKSYEQYRIASPIPKIKSYEQYRIAPTISQESPSQESPGFLGRIGQFGTGALKGAVEGLTSLGEMALTPTPLALKRLWKGEAPQPYTAEVAEKLESKFPHPSKEDTLGNILHHAGEFGGGVAAFPYLGAVRGPSLLSRFAKNIGTGSAIGAVSGGLQEGGVNPLAADIASIIVTPTLTPRNLLNVAKKAKEAAPRIPMKLMGLTPKGINLPAAQAARDLGIDLPAAALTESKLTNHADSLIGKAPFLGEKLSQKYATTQEQTKKALEDIYNRIGPKRTPEIEEEIGQLYKERKEALPKGAAIKPIHLDKALKDININSALLSTDEKNLLTSLNTLKDELNPLGKIKSSFGEIKGNLEPMSLERLIGTKTSLNSIIKWEKDEGVKNLLRNVRHGLTEDIAEYGKTNPEWYKKFKEADKLYGDVARREKIEDLLGQRGFNYATDTLSYNALAKLINNSKTAKNINRQLSPEIVNKIEKLGEVTKAMAIKNKNIPNPSGTATTAAIGGLITGLILRPWETLPAAIGSYGLTKLLTDKKFLDLAIKYAENPNKSSLLDIIALNKIIKDRTGYSAVALSGELNRVPQEVQE